MTDHNATILSIIKSRPDLANAISQHKIANEFILRRNENITPRRVRRIIEELIEQGEPIISSPRNGEGGYSYGGAEGEAIQCYRRLRRKGIRVLLRARRILRNERNRKGQQSLFAKQYIV